MMPTAPSTAILPASKPKIGFSIDSIVGAGRPDSDYEDDSRKKSSFDRSRSSSPEPACIERNNNPLAHLHQGISSFLKSQPQCSPNGSICSNSNHGSSSSVDGHSEPNSPVKISSTTDEEDEDGLKKSDHHVHRRSPLSQASSPKASGKSHHPEHPVPEIHHPPPLSLLRGPPPPHFPYPPGILNFASLAAAAQSHHHPQLPQQHPLAWLHGQPHPVNHPSHLPGHPHSLPPGHPATTHPLYPWFLAKHGRFFPHRFGVGPADLHGFLLQPFRKPKRIRTAFSPTQLLKLEHAFEKNHYVVGAERKQLANTLSLSETQVKVWFQNRRTKHKRVEQEEESTTSSSTCKSHNQINGSSSGSGTNNNSLSMSPATATAASADTTTKLSSRRYSSSPSSEDEEEPDEGMLDDEEGDEEILMDDFEGDGNSDNHNIEQRLEQQHQLEMLRQQQEQLFGHGHPNSNNGLIRSHLLSSVHNNNLQHKINVPNNNGSNGNLFSNKYFNHHHQPASSSSNSPISSPLFLNHSKPNH